MHYFLAGVFMIPSIPLPLKMYIFCVIKKYNMFYYIFLQKNFYYIVDKR